MATTNTKVNPPATLPADFSGWDNNPPATLPANFSGWDGSQPAQQFGSQSPDQILKQGAGFDPNAPLPSATSRAASGAWQGVKDAVGGLFNTVAHPINAATGIYNNTADALSDAQRASQVGDVSRRNLDYLRAIPVVGPMAQDLGKSMAAGDYAGAGARAATSSATGAVLPKVVGGALGTAVQGAGRVAEAATATPTAQNLALTRLIVPGSPSELLTRALKPSVVFPDFEESTTNALPAISKELKGVSPTSGAPNATGGNTAPGVEGFADAAKSAKGKVNDQYEAWKAPTVNTPIDTTPLVAKQVASIPATNLFENPGIVKATQKMASSYDMSPQTVTTTSPIVDQFGKPVTTTQTITPNMPTLDDVDAIRRDTNQKLKSSVFKEGGDKNAALSNPNTARLAAVNSGTRDLVYKTISDQTGVPEQTIRDNQNLYGDLSDVATVAGKRATVYGRQNPLSLSETLAASPGKPISGAIDFFGQRVLKNATGSDALVNSALDRFDNPTGTPLQARPGLIPSSISKTGKAAQGVGGALRTAVRRTGGKTTAATSLYGGSGKKTRD